MGARSHEPTIDHPAIRFRKAWLRLESALLAGNGHVVVTATEREQAAELVDAALERSNALKILRVRAATADPLGVIDEGTTDSRSAAKRSETLRALLMKAREVHANVFAVVEDADTASAEELERVRMAVECVPDAIERLRVVLIGTPQLEVTLQEPAASALASRVSAHVRIAQPRKTAKDTALNTLSAVRVAAAGVLTLFGRNETASRESSAEPPHSVYQPTTSGEEPSGARAEPSTLQPSTQQRSASDARVAPSPAAEDPQRADAAPSPRDDTQRDVPSAPAVDTHGAAERTPSSGTAHVASQSARGKRASRDGSASVDGRGSRSASSVTPPKRTPATPPATRRTTDFGPRLKQPVVVEAAAFKDATEAESLQKRLAERFEHVLVTRVDGIRGARFSVRVTSLHSPREIAHAEREIRTLGHRPVRLTVAADEDESTGETRPSRPHARR